MSRKSAGDQMAEDLAGGCIIAVFLALWAAVAGLVAAIVRSGQQTPEEQLQRMGAQLIFGAQIIGLACPVCGESNEADAPLCFRCGSSMGPVTITPVSLDSAPTNKLTSTIDNLGKRPSLLFQGRTLMNTEFLLVFGIIVALFLFAFIILLAMS
jgi:hypothetical protein